MKNFICGSYINKELCLQNQYKQTETNSFVYKANINKQKQRPLFTKPTYTHLNKEHGLQNQQKQRASFDKFHSEPMIFFIPKVIFFLGLCEWYFLEVF